MRFTKPLWLTHGGSSQQRENSAQKHSHVDDVLTADTDTVISQAIKRTLKSTAAMSHQTEADLSRPEEVRTNTFIPICCRNRKGNQGSTC